MVPILSLLLGKYVFYPFCRDVLRLEMYYIFDMPFNQGQQQAVPSGFFSRMAFRVRRSFSSFFRSQYYYPLLVGSSVIVSAFFPPAGFALMAAGGTARLSDDFTQFFKSLVPGKIYIPFCALVSAFMVFAFNFAFLEFMKFLQRKRKEDVAEAKEKKKFDRGKELAKSFAEIFSSLKPKEETVK